MAQDEVEALADTANEHNFHFMLALGMQSALDLPPGSIIFERTVRGVRLDLWIRPLDLAIELKFMRPIPSRRNRPETQQFGSLLADMRKVVTIEARSRLVVLVADGKASAYLERNATGIVPLQFNETAEITEDLIASLPPTARDRAQARDPWTSLRCTLIWSDTHGAWRLFAWTVQPARCDSHGAPVTAAGPRRPCIRPVPREETCRYC